MSVSQESGAVDFAARLAAATPTPGGGAAAARVALFAVSLVRMVAGITLEKSDEEDARTELEAILHQGEFLDGAIRRLESDDMAAFDAYLAALRLPRVSAADRTARRAARRQAAQLCAEVPLDLLGHIVQTEALAARLRALGERVRLRAESDLPVADALSEAAFQAALHTFEANLGELDAEVAEALRGRSRQLASSRPA